MPLALPGTSASALALALPAALAAGAQKSDPQFHAILCQYKVKAEHNVALGDADYDATAVYGHIANRLNILRVLPKTMKATEGNYTEHPAIQQHNCTWLKVSIVPSSPSHADGELFSLAIHDLEFRIHPASLPLLTSS